MARLSRRGRGVTRGEYVAGFHNLPNKFAGYTLAGCTGQVPQRSADDPPAGVDPQPGGWPTVRSPSGRKRSAGRLWPQDSATPHRGSTSRKSAAIGEIEVALKHDLSNALIEFANTKIRLLTRGVFGFKSPSAENFFQVAAAFSFRPVCATNTVASTSSTNVVPTFGDAPPPTLLPDGDSRRLHPHQMLLVDLAVDQPSTGRQVKARFRE